MTAGNDPKDRRERTSNKTEYERRQLEDQVAAYTPMPSRGETRPQRTMNRAQRRAFAKAYNRRLKSKKGR